AWGRKEKKSSIRIAANTLGGALKELQKRDEWGDFRGDIDYTYKADVNDHVTEVTLTPSYTIQMPEWSGYRQAPKACQKEWDRMWRKLDEHEDGHRLIHEQALTTIQKTLDQKSDLSPDHLDSEMARIMQAAQAKQDSFDASTGHGSKQGVSLSITQECP